MSCICEFLAPATEQPTADVKPQTEQSDQTGNEVAASESLVKDSTKDNENDVTNTDAAEELDDTTLHCFVTADTLANLKCEIRNLRLTLTDTYLSIEQQETSIKSAISRQHKLEQELYDVRNVSNALAAEHNDQLEYSKSERLKLENELQAYKLLNESREKLTDEMNERNSELVKQLVEANDKIERLALKYCGLRVNAVDMNDPIDGMEGYNVD